MSFLFFDTLSRIGPHHEVHCPNYHLDSAPRVQATSCHRLGLLMWAFMLAHIFLSEQAVGRVKTGLLGFMSLPETGTPCVLEVIKICEKGYSRELVEGRDGSWWWSGDCVSFVSCVNTSLGIFKDLRKCSTRNYFCVHIIATFLNENCSAFPYLIMANIPFLKANMQLYEQIAVVLFTISKIPSAFEKTILFTFLQNSIMDAFVKVFHLK